MGDGGSDELRGADATGLKAIWATCYIESVALELGGEGGQDLGCLSLGARRIEDLPALLAA